MTQSMNGTQTIYTCCQKITLEMRILSTINDEVHLSLNTMPRTLAHELFISLEQQSIQHYYQADAPRLSQVLTTGSHVIMHVL